MSMQPTSPGARDTDMVPDPDDIDRDATAERQGRLPTLSKGENDLKKIITTLAILGGVILAVFLIIDAVRADFGPDEADASAEDDMDAAAVRVDDGNIIAPRLNDAPTDPDAPIQLAEPVPGLDGRQSVDPRQTQAPRKSEGQILAEAARRSPLVAFGSGGGDAASALRRAVGTGQDTGNIPTDFGGEGTNEAQASPLDQLRQSSAIGESRATVLPDRNFLITAGTLLPCTLQTALDSSVPGYTTCVIPRDIYSDNGRVVLMEKGTRVIGEYQGGLRRGQYRLFILWTRAVTPRGIAIDLKSPASDALGRAGVTGGVETFFWERFGAALLFSIVDDATFIAGQAITDDADDVVRVPSEASSTILEESRNIRPVLRKNQGEEVGVFVAQDFNFADVYDVQLKR